MTMALPNPEERRRFGRRWTRWLLLLTLAASVAWVMLTSYYFRTELAMDLRLLWANRSQVAAEYAPALAGMVEPAPAAVPVEMVLRARVPLPVTGHVSVADVLVGNAVYQLKELVPLIAGPGLLLLVGGSVLALICGRVLRLVDPREFSRMWPAIVIPAVLAFGTGTLFGIALYYFQEPLRQLFGL